MLETSWIRCVHTAFCTFMGRSVGSLFLAKSGRSSYGQLPIKFTPPLLDSKVLVQQAVSEGLERGKWSRQVLRVLVLPKYLKNMMDPTSFYNKINILTFPPNAQTRHPMIMWRQTTPITPVSLLIQWPCCTTSKCRNLTTRLEKYSIGIQNRSGSM